MSKRFYILSSIVCAVLCISAILLYLYKTAPHTEAPIYTDTVLSPKEVKKGTVQEVVTSSKINTIETSVPSSTLSLLAVGDIMLDRSVMLKTQAAGDYNHPFLLIDPLFKEYNLHIANLEGPITNFKSIANGTGGERFTFTFSPKFVEPLKNRFEFLSLANNHAYNFGQKGLDQTRTFLGDAGVKYFGGPDNTLGNIFVTSSYNGITLGFIGYHQLVEKGFENIIAEAKRLDREVDVLIALPHWGIEYEQVNPSYLQKKEGHEMVDAGVDIIIGAHPHVVQPIEIYKDKMIFYSLGNFVFDQYFSEETQTGLAVGMTMYKESGMVKVEYKLIPLNINGQSQPSVANTQKTEKVLQNLSRNSMVPEDIKEQIKQGFIKK